ncbi:MAG: hypothetical protein Kow0063_07710 [Anaerolineae bacterium]
MAFGRDLGQLHFTLDKNVKIGGWITLMEEKGIALDPATMGNLEQSLQFRRVQASKGVGSSKKLDQVSRNHCQSAGNGRFFCVSPGNSKEHLAL